MRRGGAKETGVAIVPFGSLYSRRRKIYTHIYIYIYISFLCGFFSFFSSREHSSRNRGWEVRARARAVRNNKSSLNRRRIFVTVITKWRLYDSSYATLRSYLLLRALRSIAPHDCEPRTHLSLSLSLSLSLAGFGNRIRDRAKATGHRISMKELIYFIAFHFEKRKEKVTLIIITNTSSNTK